MTAYYIKITLQQYYLYQFYENQMNNHMYFRYVNHVIHFQIYNFRKLQKKVCALQCMYKIRMIKIIHLIKVWLFIDPVLYWNKIKINTPGVCLFMVSLSYLQLTHGQSYNIIFFYIKCVLYLVAILSQFLYL